MNIIFITPRFDEHSGGDGLYAYYLTSAISRKYSYNCIVFTIENDNFVVKEFDKHYNKFVIKEKYGSIPVIEKPLVQNIYNPKLSRYTYDLLNKSKPDIIHIHGIHQYFTISCFDVLKNFKIPKVFTIHDYKLLCGNAGFFSNRTSDICLKCLNGKTLYPLTERCKENSIVKSAGIMLQMSLWKQRRFLQNINYFHCGSKFVYSLLSRNRLLKNKLNYIRFPILKDVSGNSTIRLNIVYIGRFVPHKGITIFAETVKDINNISINIFGDGKEKSVAENILKGKSNVKFYGWRTHKEISESLHLGTIVIVPYLVHETFCYVVLESMLAGCCVVASDRGAISELISNGKNGVLINNIHANNFRTELYDLLRNPSRIYELGKNAMMISYSVDDLSTHTEKMIDFYKKIVD